VVTLFLALATLTNVGFSASFDVATCELAPAELTAVELLAYLDDPCYAAMVNQVESEIDRTFTGTGPDPALLERFKTTSDSSVGGTVEYLALIEAEDAWDYRPSATSSARSSSSDSAFDAYLDYIKAEDELLDGPPSASSARSASCDSAFRAYLDYIEAEEELLDGPPSN
jgi:hypothetical protein